MPRGRPRKKKDDVLVKSAEMIGWAIGGIEREIMSTRERLAALSAQAATLRARLPGGGGVAARGGASAGGCDGRDSESQGKAAPPQDVTGGAQAHLRDDEEALGRTPKR